MCDMSVCLAESKPVLWGGKTLTGNLLPLQILTISHQPFSNTTTQKSQTQEM